MSAEIKCDAERAIADSSRPTNEVLTGDIVEKIVNVVEDARDIANLRCVCKAFNEGGKNVVSVRYVCREKDHEKARRKTSAIESEKEESEKLRDAGNGIGELDDISVVVPHQDDGSSDQNSKIKAGDSNSRRSELIISFRQAVEKDLETMRCILQLRIEIEPKLQSKAVAADERANSDFWLSDPIHLSNWVPSVAQTLQHLCIVDYGQQAIVRVSPILEILSHCCHRLKTMDLRNMWITTKECGEMLELTSFTLRCVKINEDALNDINKKMKNLQTLALLGVFGIVTGDLKLQYLKVMCLGLSTKAKVVTMDLPSLSKLQLKMACPDEITIKALALKYVAFNLEVQDSLADRDSLALKFVQTSNLQELLYGASKFVALSELVKGNQFLNKVFLDIPCMALGEDGRWLGVLREVPLYIPSFKTLALECPNLIVLNVGPGLWYSMEINIEMVQNVERWPRVQTLILQMIPKMLETSVAILRTLLTAMNDTLVNLEIYVHTTSPVNSEEFFEAIQNQVQHLNLKQKLWTKSLDFSCFTF